MLDAAVIGGGFYGVCIALYLRRVRGLSEVALFERGPALMSRASYNNQARVHNGYHYPRSYQTAFRSRVNLPRFVNDFPFCLKRDFTHLYAIARLQSKVNAAQFSRFCAEIGARIEPASGAEAGMFNARFVEKVYRVEEMAFDAQKLQEWAVDSLARDGVTVHCDTAVTDVLRGPVSGIRIQTDTAGGDCDESLARYVFNCTYSGLQSFRGTFAGSSARLKHEIAELALVKVPTQLSNYGITVMDGPFFSLTPFPARGTHALSHVRYTPHMALQSDSKEDPYAFLASYARESRFDRMWRDASRYLPCLSQLTQEDSLFEVKTVLVKNELDDGRPILFERHEDLPGCYSILGGKIDNIYDIIKRLDAEPLARSSTEVHR
jgi:glycine/D-amino acid oxidase-like deaminating enzyme